MGTLTRQTSGDEASQEGQGGAIEYGRFTLVEAQHAVIYIEDDQRRENVLGELRKHLAVFAVEGASPLLWPQVHWLQGYRWLPSHSPRPATAWLSGVDREGHSFP